MIKTSIKVRASSMGQLFDCAHRWEWSTLLRRGGPGGMRALLGSGIHHASALFDASRLPGRTPIDPDDAADAFYSFMDHPPFDVDYTSDDLRMPDAKKIGLKVLAKYIQEIAPQFHYIDVESTLTPLEIDCGGGVEIVLTGQMDRARIDAGPNYTKRNVIDLKTGKAAVSGGVVSVKKHLAQLGVYELLDEQTSKVESSGARIIGMSTSAHAEVAISPIVDAKRVLLGVPETEDAPRQKGMLDYAITMFREGDFPPNPQSSMCSKKYCSRWNNCIFHD